jgi:hypothetical protein
LVPTAIYPIFSAHTQAGSGIIKEISQCDTICGAKSKK